MEQRSYPTGWDTTVDTATCKLQRGVMQLREGRFTTAAARVRLKRIYPSL